MLLNEEIIVKEEEKQYEIFKVRGNKFYHFMKRLEDICASFLAIVVLCVPMLIIGIIVKLTSKGPVLFKDNRVGMNGKKIKVLKYRSMYIDAEENIEKYLTEEQKVQWMKERKIDKDPRITPIGRFLRKTSLDELPQLFNILKGDISLVGPRPVTQRELEDNYTEPQRKALLSIRPGLTGYWQVVARSDSSYENGDRQKLELEYLTIRGFWYDIGLLFRTIPVVLKRKGAK